MSKKPSIKATIEEIKQAIQDYGEQEFKRGLAHNQIYFDLKKESPDFVLKINGDITKEKWENIKKLAEVNLTQLSKNGRYH